jgi:enamine deaminase RidA (YjgF/YER057c/UK114 family)
VPDICHRVGIADPRHRVCEDSATRGRLVEFWTSSEGEPELGGEVTFFFGGGIAEQSERAFRNIEDLLRAAGASRDDVTSCLVYLADPADVPAFNGVDTGRFRARPSRYERPCVGTWWRTCASKLPSSPASRVN